MVDPKSKSAEYRKKAAACLEVAEQMSLIEDRALMLEMAQQWLDLARPAEAQGEQAALVGGLVISRAWEAVISPIGASWTSDHVHFSAASGRTADTRRALMRGAPIYESPAKLTNSQDYYFSR